MEPSKDNKSEVRQNQPNSTNHRRKIKKDTRYIIVSPTPLIGSAPEKDSVPPESLPVPDNHISFIDLMTTAMKGIWIRKHTHGFPETRCSHCHRNGLVTYISYTSLTLCLSCTDNILVACDKIQWVPPNTKPIK